MSIGVDEVGRGCIAGDLVVCAFRLKADLDEAARRDFFSLAMDSKAFRSRKAREKAAVIMREAGEFEVVRATPQEIDALNIRGATLWAMQEAATRLIARTGRAKVYFDGKDCPDGFQGEGEAVIKGDSKVPEISAASIIAKTLRDAEMDEAAKLYPVYGFEKHAGYGTAQHRLAIAERGLCPLHRSWARKFLAG